MAWMDITASIIGWLFANLYFPAIGFMVAFTFKGYYKYSPCFFPEFALPRPIFWFLWLPCDGIVAMSGWIMWYNYSGFDIVSYNYIVLIMVFIYSLIAAPWPIFTFVFNSIIVGALFQLVLAVYVGGLILAICLINFDLTCVIILVIPIVYRLYVAFLFVVTARTGKFKLPSASEIKKDIIESLSVNCEKEKQKRSANPRFYGLGEERTREAPIETRMSDFYPAQRSTQNLNLDFTK